METSKMELSQRVRWIMHLAAYVLSIKDYFAFAERLNNTKDFISLSPKDRNLILKLEEQDTVIGESLGYNPNREEDGKFGFGKGSGSQPANASAGIMYEEEFDANEQGEPYSAASGYVQEARSISLDDAELEGVEIYSDTAFSDINEYLKTGKSTEYAGQIDFIDAAIAKGDIHRDTVVYRGIDTGDAKEVNRLMAMAETGGSITSKGYFSSSLVPEVASDFTKGGNGAVIFRIHLSKNDNALLLPKVGSTSNIINNEEFEYLLPRGQRYSIIYAGTLNVNGLDYKMIGLE